MGWFPTKLDSEEPRWHFDILILLAIIGGSVTQRHRPAIRASALSLFPRLMPAPEALFDTSPQYRAPSTPEAGVVGVHSATILTELNYFANVLHNVEDVKPFEYRHCAINYNYGDDEEKADPRKIRVKTTSCINVITILSIFMSVGLLVFAGVVHDGAALVGIATMALSTSAASLSVNWSPGLSIRTVHKRMSPGLSLRTVHKIMPPSDVVLRTRGGGFIVVRGTEQAIRELYTGMDYSSYNFPDKVRHVLLAMSTFLLMISVIMFSNSSEKMQIAVSAAYFILNILYSGIAFIKPRNVWDLSRYKLRHDMHRFAKSYTEALWLAISDTCSIDWVRRADMAPKTEAWDKWLQEACENALKGNKDWPAEQRKDELIAEYLQKLQNQNGVLPQDFCLDI